MKKRGFTLIELLVVIAIIAILATVVIINVTGARGKAANSKTLSDMSAVQKIATICLAEDYYLKPGPPPNGSLVLTFGENVCQSSTEVPGTWPNINVKSSNGREWKFDGASTKGQTIAPPPSFPLTIIAYTKSGSSLVAGDYRINCTATGCKKEQYDITLPLIIRWNGVVTW